MCHGSGLLSMGFDIGEQLSCVNHSPTQEHFIAEDGLETFKGGYAMEFASTKRPWKGEEVTCSGLLWKDNATQLPLYLSLLLMA